VIGRKLSKLKSLLDEIGKEIEITLFDIEKAIYQTGANDDHSMPATKKFKIG
jgi:hypothetical protein